ncbi:hypothetical protein Mapa_006758 [Marchantia paleacea]|nr:hypothetical protein Mapa_006758 [Marchantia paleacea]
MSFSCFGVGGSYLSFLVWQSRTIVLQCSTTITTLLLFTGYDFEKRFWLVQRLGLVSAVAAAFDPSGNLKSGVVM